MPLSGEPLGHQSFRSAPEGGTGGLGIGGRDTLLVMDRVSIVACGPPGTAAACGRSTSRGGISPGAGRGRRGSVPAANSCGSIPPSEEAATARPTASSSEFWKDGRIPNSRPGAPGA
jgi:hypothetical protein